MIGLLRDIQLYRNSDINTFTTYSEVVDRMTHMVTNDSDNIFKDGQIVLGRFRDGERVRTIVGTVSASGANKYIDFLTVRDDVDSAVEAALNNINGSAAIAQLSNGTLTIKEVAQQGGEIDEGGTLVTLYIDTDMDSSNPLASESTVDAKIADERAKDYINSVEYESGNPLNLTSSEIAALSQVYRVGHIVHDAATNRFYAWYGNGWGYPTVEVTSNTALAQFVSNRELLVLNDEPIHFEGGAIKAVTYVPVYGEPLDWDVNWDKYYLWDSTDNTYHLNLSSTYDNTKVYHIKNITDL